MASKQLELILKLKDGASRGFSNVGKSIESVARTAAKAAAVLGTMSAAIGVVAVNKAADFQKSMSNVATLVDTSTESMKDMSAKVIEISSRLPVDIEDLTRALYDVRSAGISSADAMLVLEKSAKLGVAGLGTTKEAVDLATSAINSFKFSGDEAANVFDVLQLSVKNGKTTISELAQSFGLVSGISSTLGVSFNELMASTAALTTTGLKASVAQTQLKSAMISLSAPSEDMRQVLESIGYSSGKAIIEQLGLVESMKLINSAVQNDTAALKLMYGRTEALNASIGLTGTLYNKFNVIMDETSNSSGVLNEAFEKQTQTFAAQRQILKNNLGSVLKTLGKDLLPRVTKQVKLLTKWIQNNKEEIEEFIHKAVNILIGTFDLLTGRIQIVVAALKPLTKWIQNNKEEIQAFIYKALQPLGHWFSNIKKEIQGFIEQGLKNLKQSFENNKEAIQAFIDQAINALMIAFDLLTGRIQIVVGAFNLLKEWFGNNKEAIKEFIDKSLETLKIKFDELKEKIKGFIDVALKSLKEWFNENKEAIKEFIDKSLETLKIKFDELKESASNAWGEIKKFNKELKQADSTYFSDAIDILSDEMSNFSRRIKEDVMPIWNMFKDQFKENGDEADLFGGTMKTLLGVLYVVSKSISTIIIGAMSGVLIVLTGIIEAFKMIIDLGKLVGKAIGLVTGKKTVEFTPSSSLGKIVSSGIGVLTGNNDLQYFSNGGVVQGIGGGDNVPAMLTPGEIILNQGQQNNVADSINRKSSISITGNNFYGTADDMADQIFEILQQKIQHNIRI